MGPTMGLSMLGLPMRLSMPGLASLRSLRSLRCPALPVPLDACRASADDQYCSIVEKRDLTALEKLAELGAFAKLRNISGALKLTSSSVRGVGLGVAVFAELVEVGGALEVSNNPILDLGNDSFPVLASIGGPLTLRKNGQVTTLGAFAGLAHVGGAVTISGHAKLTKVTASSFGLLARCGAVSVTDNAKLEHLPVFASLVQVEAGLEFSRNPAYLPATDHFPVLEHLGTLRLVGDQSDNHLHNMSAVGSLASVRVASRTMSPPWGSIRFRLAPRTYDPRGVRVVSRTKLRKIPTPECIHGRSSWSSGPEHLRGHRDRQHGHRGAGSRSNFPQ